MNTVKGNTGFTLVELIVVIVVLGILSAAAMPRFFNFTTDARISALQAAKGALQSTASMARGKYIMTGAFNINVEGTVMALTNPTGYPEADAAFATVAGLNGGDYTLTYTVTTMTVQLAQPLPNCSVIYTESTFSPPTFVMTTSGC